MTVIIIFLKKTRLKLKLHTKANYTAENHNQVCRVSYFYLLIQIQQH